MTNIDYTKHKLTDHAELAAYYTQTFSTKSGDITFWQYAEKLYRKITMMVPGESLVIDDIVDEYNRDVLIKLLCGFIAGGVAQDFIFNDNYTEFRRSSAPITQSIEHILKRQQL